MKKILLLASVIFSLTQCNKTNISSCCDANPQVAGVDSSVIAVPDIFTPNGDGINDVQYVLQRNIASLKFTVKKRNKVLFETLDGSGGWDGTYNGKDVKEKEYDFKVEATTVNGKSLSLSGTFCMIKDNCAKGSVSKCCFATQFNGSTFDLNLPSLENIKQCK